VISFKSFLLLGLVLVSSHVHAEYLQGKIGNIKNLIKHPDYKAHVYISYIRRSRLKAVDCGINYAADKLETRQIALVKMASDGSITLDKPIGGKPKILEVECWYAAIVVNHQDGEYNYSVNFMDLGMMSSPSFYVRIHSNDDSYSSYAAHSAKTIKDYLNSNYQLVLAPKVYMNLVKTAPEPSDQKKLFDFAVDYQAGSFKKQIYSDDGAFILPLQPFAKNTFFYRQWVLLPPDVQTVSMQAEAFVFTRDQQRRVDKKCSDKFLKEFPIDGIPDEVTVDLNLDCTPVN
jgi:hypothetical protein